jgi:aromatic ring hydroxylase
VERGILAAPGSVPCFNAALVPLERVRFYKAHTHMHTFTHTHMHTHAHTHTCTHTHTP